MTSVITDTARENSGALQNNFDKDRVQSEINLQMDVTKNFDANRQEAKAEINKKIDDAKKENQSIIDKQKQGLGLSKQEQDQLNAYNDKVENYQKLGVLLDSISTGLSAPTSSGLGIATATLSPAASYKIGQYFKEQASNNANGQLTSGQEAAHILAHTVLGAAVAAAGGNDAFTAGLSAGGAEAAAPVLSSFLYGKAAKDLTADQKSTISSIVGLAGSAVGSTTGDIGSTVQSGQVAQNAVENNEFSIVTDASNKQAGKSIAKMRAECQANGINPNSAACGQYQDTKLRKDASDTLGNLSNGATLTGLYPTPASPYLLGAGSLLGIGSTLLDDSKDFKQKAAEILLSYGASQGAEKLLKTETTIAPAVKSVYAEYAGKTAEQIPSAIKECNKDPKQIGCAK